VIVSVFVIGNCLTHFQFGHSWSVFISFSTLITS